MRLTFKCLINHKIIKVLWLMLHKILLENNKIILLNHFRKVQILIIPEDKILLKALSEKMKNLSLL